MTKRQKLLIAWGDISLRLLSISAFITSLFLPVFNDRQGLPDKSWMSGGFVLKFGALGFLIGQFAWLANIILPINLLIPNVFTAVALIACLISASVFDNMPDDTGHHAITGYGAGYYIWFLSIIVGALPALFPSPSKLAQSSAPETDA